MKTSILILSFLAQLSWAKSSLVGSSWSSGCSVNEFDQISSVKEVHFKTAHLYQETYKNFHNTTCKGTPYNQQKITGFYDMRSSLPNCRKLKTQELQYSPNLKIHLKKSEITFPSDLYAEVEEKYDEFYDLFVCLNEKKLQMVFLPTLQQNQESVEFSVPLTKI